MNKSKILKLVAGVLAVLTLGGALLYFNVAEKDNKGVAPSSSSVEQVESDSSEQEESDSDQESDSEQEEEGNEGVDAPDFSVETYKVVNGVFQRGGETFTLSEQTKVTVINFWATWCVPCKAEMPNFDKLQKNYPDYVTVIILDYTDNIKFLNEHTDAIGWENFDVTFGQFNIAENNVLTAYGYTGALPMTAIVDENGKLVYHRVGGMTYKELETETKKYLPEDVEPLYPDDVNAVTVKKNWWKENVLGVTFLAVSTAALGTAIVVSAVSSAKEKKKKKTK
ncbi:MAG: TlpA family protein disulfide reductase [Clostridiales bacterium]|nr:TlpA family protein disulfide reductase [Clostridiales bacterium]